MDGVALNLLHFRSEVTDVASHPIRQAIDVHQMRRTCYVLMHLCANGSLLVWLLCVHAHCSHWRWRRQHHVAAAGLVAVVGLVVAELRAAKGAKVERHRARLVARPAL